MQATTKLDSVSNDVPFALPSITPVAAESIAFTFAFFNVG